MKQKTLSFVSCTKTASNRLGDLNWKASSSITKISRQIIQFEVVYGKADKQNSEFYVSGCETASSMAIKVEH